MKTRKHYHIVRNHDGSYRDYINTTAKDPMKAWCQRENIKYIPVDLHAIEIDKCAMDDHSFWPEKKNIHRHKPAFEADQQVRCRECGRNFDSVKEGREDQTECPGIPNLFPLPRLIF